MPIIKNKKIKKNVSFITYNKPSYKFWIVNNEVIFKNPPKKTPKLFIKI